MDTELAFTEQDTKRLRRMEKTIDTMQNRAEGLAETIATQLYLINKDSLYKIDNYTSMGKYASDKFNISKGTCSDSIGVISRFGSEVDGKLLPAFEKYSFSSLMVMKNFSDEELTSAGVTPEMSRSEIRTALVTLKLEENSKEERLKAETEWTNNFEILSDKLRNDEITVEIYEALTKNNAPLSERDVEDIKVDNKAIAEVIRQCNEGTSKEEIEEQIQEEEEDAEYILSKGEVTLDVFPEVVISKDEFTTRESIYEELSPILDGYLKGEYTIKLI